MAKSEMFENLKNLSKSSASECDLIKANIDRVAIPLAGVAFKIVVDIFCVFIRPLFQGLVANLLFLRRRKLEGWLMESTPPSSTGCRSVLKIHNNFPPLFLITKSTPLHTGQHPRLWLRPVQHPASCLRPRGRHGQGVGGAWGRTCWTGETPLFFLCQQLAPWCSMRKRTHQDCNFVSKSNAIDLGKEILSWWTADFYVHKRVILFINSS